MEMNNASDPGLVQPAVRNLRPHLVPTGCLSESFQFRLFIRPGTNRRRRFAIVYTAYTKRRGILLPNSFRNCRYSLRGGSRELGSACARTSYLLCSLLDLPSPPDHSTVPWQPHSVPHFPGFHLGCFSGCGGGFVFAGANLS